MESYWSKFLLDGSVELGTDSAIAVGKASWTGGRQDIGAASLNYAGASALLTHLPEDESLVSWAQRDRCIAEMTLGMSWVYARTIFCNVNGCTRFIAESSPGDLRVIVSPNGIHPMPDWTKSIGLCIDRKGQITVEFSKEEV